MQYSAYLEPGCTRDRYHVFSLSQHPRQRDLSGGGVVFPADILQTLRELEDVREVLFRVPRNHLAEVPILEVIRGCLQRNSMGCCDVVQESFTHIATSEEAPSEGRVGNDLHAEFPRSFQKSNGLFLDV